jgi:hypothetical protein
MQWKRKLLRRLDCALLSVSRYINGWAEWKFKSGVQGLQIID